MKHVYRISIMNGREIVKEIYTSDPKNGEMILDMLNSRYVSTKKNAISDYTIHTDVIDDSTVESIKSGDYGYDMIVTLNDELEPIAFQIVNVFPWLMKDPIVEMIVDVKHRIPTICYVKLLVVAKGADAAIERATHLIAKELPIIENW